MTEEKAQDTLKVGIEELLEKEGASFSDIVNEIAIQSRDEMFMCPIERGYFTACVSEIGGLRIRRPSTYGDGDCNMLCNEDIHAFIKWLQDNFLPKGKKDGGQKGQIFLCNNYIKIRDDGESAMVFGNGTHLDGYAIIPIEEYEELGGKPFEREDSKTPFEDA